MTPLTEASAVDRVWRLNPTVDLKIDVLGDSCLIFEATSSETEAVEPLTAAVLECFRGTGRRAGEVIDSLATELGVATTSALRDEVLDAIEDFAARGWLESATLAE